MVAPSPQPAPLSWKTAIIWFIVGAVFLLILLIILANTLPADDSTGGGSPAPSPTPSQASQPPKSPVVGAPLFNFQTDGGGNLPPLIVAAPGTLTSLTGFPLASGTPSSVAGSPPSPVAGSPQPSGTPSPVAGSPPPSGTPSPVAGSPQPSATLLVPSANGGSAKKGFVVGSQDSTVGGAKVNSLNCKWYYTWGSAPMSPPPASGIPFTPMFWNVVKCSGCHELDPYPTAVSKSISEIQSIQNLPAPAENVLLGYNEPDGTTDAQANMKVSDAAAFWPNIVATGRRLGSPVMYGDLVETPADTYGTGKNVNNDGPPSGVSGPVQIDISNNSTPNLVTLNPLIWLDNFLIQVSMLPGAKKFPDFICVHWYGKPDSSAFLTYLTNVNAKYHLPIWVTEYSCADWAATCCPPTHVSGYDWSLPTSDNLSTNGTAQFMLETVQGMNQMAFVERFSWKERTLLGNSDGTPTGADAYMSQTAVPRTTQGGPDYMNQSALFQSYVRFPNALPGLTPLGQLYASL